MAILKRRNETPPGGWVYFQKETEYTMKSENEDSLIALVVAHRKYRNLQPQEPALVALDVERQICVRLGFGECKREGTGDAWVPRDGSKQPVTMSGVLAFSRAALAFLASGAELAPMDEVARRAAGCRACPLNQPMSGCACNIFYKAIDAAIPRARRFDGLHVCRACDCSLVAKVNLTPAQIVVSNEGRNITWPEQECFQKTIMQQHAAANLPSA